MKRQILFQICAGIQCFDWVLSLRFLHFFNSVWRKSFQKFEFSAHESETIPGSFLSVIWVNWPFKSSLVGRRQETHIPPAVSLNPATLTTVHLASFNLFIPFCFFEKWSSENLSAATISASVIVRFRTAACLRVKWGRLLLWRDRGERPSSLLSVWVYFTTSKRTRFTVL